MGFKPILFAEIWSKGACSGCKSDIGTYLDVVLKTRV